MVALDFSVPGRAPVVIERIAADDVVGWSWLLPPYRWSLGAVVTGECRAVEFEASGVRAAVAEDPDLGRELTTRFMTVVAGRLQVARRRLAEFSAHPAEPPGPSRPERRDRRR